MGGYHVIAGWERLPAGITHRDVPDVATDSTDRVYVLTRQVAQVLVYEPDGAYVDAWGLGVLSAHPHAITIGPGDEVYIVDELRHSVEQYTTTGALVRRIGPYEQPSDTGADPTIPDIYHRIATIARGAGPYNRPTKVAIAPTGDLYVSDGYANASVHRFAPDGTLLATWGEPGTGPGQFHLVHSLAVTPDGRVLVCDRENDRIQVFSPDGGYLTEWTDMHRPAGIALRGDRLYVTELAWRPGFRSWRNGVVEGDHPGRLTIRDLDGRVLETIGGTDPLGPGGLTAPHGVCVDSRGDIYVAEVSWTDGVRHGRYPEDVHTLQKFSREG
jgi:DNA-binding beta-propeller fold protein YncE